MGCTTSREVGAIEPSPVREGPSSSTAQSQQESGGPVAELLEPSAGSVSEHLMRRMADDWFFKGNQLAYTSDHRGAIAAFTSALSLCPRFPKAQYQRGLAQLEVRNKTLQDTVLG